MQILLHQEPAIPPSVLVFLELTGIDILHRGGLVDYLQTVEQSQHHGGYKRRRRHPREPPETSVGVPAGKEFLDGFFPVEFRLDSKFTAETPGIEGAGEGDGIVAAGFKFGRQCLLNHLPYGNLLKLGEASVHVFEHGPEFGLERRLVCPCGQHRRMGFGQGLNGLLHGYGDEHGVGAECAVIRTEHRLDAEILNTGGLKYEILTCIAFCRYADLRSGGRNEFGRL